jgi:hypothetical protein
MPGLQLGHDIMHMPSLQLRQCTHTLALSDTLACRAHEQQQKQQQEAAAQPELKPKPQVPDWAPREDGLMARRRREQPLELKQQLPPVPAATGGTLGPDNAPPQPELPGQVRLWVTSCCVRCNGRPKAALKTHSVETNLAAACGCIAAT